MQNMCSDIIFPQLLSEQWTVAVLEINSYLLKLPCCGVIKRLNTVYHCTTGWSNCNVCWWYFAMIILEYIDQKCGSAAIRFDPMHNSCTWNRKSKYMVSKCIWLGSLLASVSFRCLAKREHLSNPREMEAGLEIRGGGRCQEATRPTLADISLIRTCCGKKVGVQKPSSPLIALYACLKLAEGKRRASDLCKLWTSDLWGEEKWFIFLISIALPLIYHEWKLMLSLTRSFKGCQEV